MSTSLDFPTSKLPELKPLENSFAYDAVEKELKDLFIQLYKENLGQQTFDTCVLGVPHLGSFELVQKTINRDGLSLLRNSAEETATRYLYRAWKSGDIQKRGLSILKIYLQLLFGSLAQVTQLQHPKSGATYPQAVSEYFHNTGLSPNNFLTSRIYVDVDTSLASESIKSISSSIQSALPARFVPEIRFKTFTTKSQMSFNFAAVGNMTVQFDGSGTLVG